MPYKTKTERERENWMTLPEAVDQIRSADNCDERSARRLLVSALSDGLRGLGLLKWERESGDQPPPFGTTSITTSTDTPPLGRDWLDAKIRWRTGRVRDDWGEYKSGKWRVLLLSRHGISRHWAPSRLANPGIPTSAKVINLSAHGSGGRPSERNQVYDALNKMHQEGFNMALPQKKLAEEAAKRNSKRLGDPSWSERAIIGHVSEWLDKHR